MSNGPEPKEGQLPDAAPMTVMTAPAAMSTQFTIRREALLKLREQLAGTENETEMFNHLLQFLAGCGVQTVFGLCPPVEQTRDRKPRIVGPNGPLTPDQQRKLREGF